MLDQAVLPEDQNEQISAKGKSTIIEGITELRKEVPDLDVRLGLQGLLSEADIQLFTREKFMTGQFLNLQYDTMQDRYGDHDGVYYNIILKDGSMVGIMKYKEGISLPAVVGGIDNRGWVTCTYRLFEENGKPKAETTDQLGKKTLFEGQQATKESLNGYLKSAMPRVVETKAFVPSVPSK
ncbi:MAG: hypothetical protein UR54_C0015G0003 [Candidatus Roizmanbacteria bacterium GW2011_GWA2_34_18]|uniref:Uncharacterized protein n=1 Tax=Candidatus Roizmanbacteria bacterium GW2011_GWA2_34_18 TaxID=1618477 RepID=A0A0G0DYP1_9BACT|nr:MAG: hypothetical protein UR54_C0015G0003 [Candidatus Roizmanbacteria bacterium GW2011_GWA2_34_18]